MKDRTMEFWYELNNEIRGFLKANQTPTMDAVISLWQLSHEAIHRLDDKNLQEVFELTNERHGLKHGMQVYEGITQIVKAQNQKDVEYYKENKHE